ncbi:MAG: hypothetical protein KC413_12175, partial [Anaerolineales bacterium]|nr:hypothetical protein [Anaerolineales bacterium]
MKKYLKLLTLTLVAMMILVACGGSNTPAPEVPAPAAEEPAVEEPAADEPTAPEASGEAVFFSTQFVPVEEQEKFRA